MIQHEGNLNTRGVKEVGHKRPCIRCSVYMKGSEEQTRRDSGSPELEGGGNEHDCQWVSFGGDENVLKLDSDDGCANL